MTDLPIEAIRPALRECLQRTRRVVIKAPTGSGKSTRVPQMLADEAFPCGGEILVLQPRRIAARMLAARVAAERGTRLGDEVGYQIRFERVVSPETRIHFLTEGILLRRMLDDPALKGVAAVVLDEFHERHLAGDLCLARALLLQSAVRPDLAVVVMSATLDTASLQTALGPQCAVVEAAGRMFPVEVRYLSKEPGEAAPWELAARVLRDEFSRTTGHALVFMPGAYEIQRTVREIRAELSGNIPVFALHGEMPAQEQDEAVGRSETKKIIVSTNVAETSLTIEGVTLVVDSGLVRAARFDPHRGINTLHIEKISQASAEQRAGRAGRTAPGLCIRLWTQRDHANRAARETPEIHRLDLSESLLLLKAGGVKSLADFPWFEVPQAAALQRAIRLLTDLGALEGASETITNLGRQMAAFPAHPRIARLLIEAGKRNCVFDAAMIAALMQSRSLLVKADRKTEEEREELLGGSTSDFTLLFRAVEFARKKNFHVAACRGLGIHAETARQVLRTQAQFLELARRSGLPVAERRADEESVAKCVLAAFADQVARRRSAGNYQCEIVHARRGVLDRGSQAADANLVVAAEIEEIGRRDGMAEVRLGLVTAIEEDWLREIAPQDLHESAEFVFDTAQNRVVERRALRFHDLIIRSFDRDAEPGAQAAAVLAATIRERKIPLDGWGEEAEEWIARVNFVAEQFPELEIATITASDRELLLEQFCEGATCLRDLKTKSARPTLRAWLRPDQVNAVERLAPERISLPGGKTARVRYGENGGPRIAVRIQELFGTHGGLFVGGGRIPLTIEVLAPNHRPVQVTRDLSTFWKETYPALRNQLQRRYPKHRWDP